MSGTRPRATGTAPSQQRFAIADQNGELLVALQNPPAPLTVGSVEAFLNDFLPSHPEAGVDYIHGSSTAMALASRPGQKARRHPAAGPCQGRPV